MFMGAGQAGLGVIMILLCPKDTGMTVIMLYVRQRAFITGMDKLVSFLFLPKIPSVTNSSCTQYRHTPEQTLLKVQIRYQCFYK